MTLDRSLNRRARRSATGSDRRRGVGQVRLGFESLEERRLLVVAVSGDPNNDAASLLSYGGPGDPSLPGFDNVGRGSTGATSVVYLGGGWVLTANHVTILNPPTLLPGGVSFGGTQYLVDMTTIHRLHNPDNSLADVKIFKIIGDPGLPDILPSYIATAPPDVDEHVFMIGNGLSRGDQHFWTIDTNQAPWVWTETSEPPVPGPFDVSGYDLVSPRTIRWGENEIDANNLFVAGVRGYTTQFDDLAYTGVPSLTHEAQASNGDSGGPAFYFVDGKWVLSGIMIAVSADFSGQPSSTTLLGFQTLMADMSYYRDEILEIAGVMGRHVFYNQSTFDENNAALNSSDDDAIATDKVAYLPGSGVAGPNNATSYSRGINGIMVDLASNHGPLTLDDFTFRVGANNAPSTWAAAPVPTGFTVRADAGPGGSDRVEISWADGAITNTWLEVTVEGNDAVGGFNANTGLASTDIFYFGNIVGDTFVDTPSGVFLVTVADEIAIQTKIITAATITSIWDMDRNGVHLVSDRIVTRAHTITALNRISITDPPAAPAPPDSDDDGAPSAVATGLSALNASEGGSSTGWIKAALASISVGSGPAAAASSEMVEGNTPRSNAPGAVPASTTDDPGASAVAFAIGRTGEAGHSTHHVPHQVALSPRTVDEQRAPRERIFEQLAIARQDELLRADDEDLASTNGESLLVEAALEFARTGTTLLSRPIL